MKFNKTTQQFTDWRVSFCGAALVGVSIDKVGDCYLGDQITISTLLIKPNIRMYRPTLSPKPQDIPHEVYYYSPLGEMLDHHRIPSMK